MSSGSENRKRIVVGLALSFAFTGAVKYALANEKSTPADLFLGITPDARKGYEAITTMPMGDPVMKVADLERLCQVWEEEEKTKAKRADHAELMRMTFERYGWAKRPGDKVAGIPLDFTEDGKGNLVYNCFSCHGGKVAGKTMPGAGNTHIDMTTFLTDLTRLHALDKGKDPSSVKEFVLGERHFVANYHKGFTNAVIFEVSHWVSQNPPVMFAVAANPEMLQHHDMNPPPWWTTKKKNRLYSDAFAPKTPRQNMPFARRRSLPNWEKEWRALEPTFVHIYQYIEELEAPKYPFEIDDQLAAKGKTLFGKTCAKCHGTYGPDGEYPNRVVPIEQVGTDPVRLHAVPREEREWKNKNWLQYNGEYPVWLESKGYRAPPLDGIWASAPYFHNGAAPTLWDVMNPTKRPKVWKRTEDGYDKTKVGLEVQVFDAVPENVNPRIRRMYYDTTHKGNSAAGHTFADVLDSAGKMAVIEYLKTL
jgi:mono/diheme cytochrome c family protein